MVQIREHDSPENCQLNFPGSTIHEKSLNNTQKGCVPFHIQHRHVLVVRVYVSVFALQNYLETSLYNPKNKKITITLNIQNGENSQNGHTRHFQTKQGNAFCQAYITAAQLVTLRNLFHDHQQVFYNVQECDQMTMLDYSPKTNISYIVIYFQHEETK